MSLEEREHDMVRCYWCETNRPRAHIRFVDENVPVCAPNIDACKKEYYDATRPKPVPILRGRLDCPRRVERSVATWEKG